MESIEEALRYLAYCISNHEEFGEVYNYEDFAKSKFKLRGHGFVLIDASNFVTAYLAQDGKTLLQVDNKYVTLNEANKEAEPQFYSALELIADYNPDIEYALFLVVHRDKLPKSLASKLSEGLVYFADRVNYSKVLHPSQITRNQIRKRLKRMFEGGMSLLILDTSKPDYMGANLGKWLREIKALEDEGKHISVMINSDSGSPAQIPSDLFDDILTLNLNGRS